MDNTYRYSVCTRCPSLHTASEHVCVICSHWKVIVRVQGCSGCVRVSLVHDCICNALFWFIRKRNVPFHLCTVYAVLPACINKQKTNCISQELENKTAELWQRRPRDARNICVPWKGLRVLTTHPATFPEICNWLLFRSILRMRVQNLKFVALPVPEIIRGTQKISAVPGYAHAPFFPKFWRDFVRMGPVNILAQLEVHSFIRFWDNRGVLKKLGQSLYTPTLHFLPNF